jgi:general L-amino acid transport system permease protein
MGPDISTAPTQNIPFWRDGRVLGVFGQIGFIILVLIVVRTLGTNFASNVNKLGESQFICADGTFSYRCAYDFMNTQAGFDISETVLPYEVSDSYWSAFYQGFLNTMKVGLLGVIFTTIVGTLAGIARLSSNWLISKIALWYVELMRNIPLLIVLFILYFGVILAGPDLKETLQPFGLPIFFNNRGLNFPWPQFTSSASTWVAFLVLGVIQYQVLSIFLDRREERTGKAVDNKVALGILSFLIIIGIGWFVASALSDTQGLLATKASRIREVEDIEQLMISRTGVNLIGDLKRLSEEELTEAALTVCVLRDSPSEVNFTSQLRRRGIPYRVTRFDRSDQAATAYDEGSCEVFSATTSVLASERATLESPASHLIVPVGERPIVMSTPAFEGLNIAGGTKLTPEFTALLVGLVLFYGGSLAELVRAGIQSVSKGQSEAARALGLSESQRLRLVVLPQSLRVIIPPLIGTYLSLIKDTSLGIALGFSDMYRVSQVTINQSGRALQVVILMMLVYLAISIVFSMLLNWYNNNYVVIVER